MDKNYLAKLDASDNKNRKYKIEAIQDSAVYVKKEYPDKLIATFEAIEIALPIIKSIVKCIHLLNIKKLSWPANSFNK